MQIDVDIHESIILLNYWLFNPRSNISEIGSFYFVHEAIDTNSMILVKIIFE